MVVQTKLSQVILELFLEYSISPNDFTKLSILTNSPIKKTVIIWSWTYPGTGQPFAGLFVPTFESIESTSLWFSKYT